MMAMRARGRVVVAALLEFAAVHRRRVALPRLTRSYAMPMRRRQSQSPVKSARSVRSSHHRDHTGDA